MPQYLLLLHRAGGACPMADLSPPEREAIFERYRSWADGLAKSGRFQGGDKLTDGPGRTIAPNGGRKAIVTDGPFAETKDVIGGYFKIEASGYDEAVELARECPHLAFGGKIEVREIDRLPGEAACAGARAGAAVA